MLSSTALRYFAEAVRQGSLSAAAETLCIATSAISRQIALLEEELDAPLFEPRRGRQKQQLAAAGEHLMGYVHEVEAETRRVRLDVQSLKGARKGRVRMGITENFTHGMVPALLARFHAEHPAVTFDVEVANTPRLIELLADSQLDVMLGFNPPQVGEMKVVAEVQLPRQVIVPHGHPLAQRAFVRLSDCAAHGMAMPSGALTAKTISDEMFASAKIKPRTVLRSNSYELIQTTAMAGMAICFGNAQLLPDPEAVSPQYRFIPVRDARVKPTRLVVAVHQHRTLPAVSIAFVDALVRQIHSLEQTST